MQTRLDLFKLLPNAAKCVEVGTRFGDFALEIIKAPSWWVVKG
jgi:hypothetical protein